MEVQKNTTQKKFNVKNPFKITSNFIKASIFAVLLTFSSLKSEAAQIESFTPTEISTDNLKSEINRYAIENWFNFSPEVVNSIIWSLVHIKTTNWEKTWFFISPNNIITTWHWNEVSLKTWIENADISDISWSKVTWITSNMNIYFDPKYDLSIIEIDWISKTYYKFISKNPYNWNIMFVWLIKDKLILSKWRADNCSEAIKIYNIDTNILKKQMETLNVTCATWKVYEWMSWGMVLDSVWNLIWIITWWDWQWRFVVSYINIWNIK